MEELRLDKRHKSLEPIIRESGRNKRAERNYLEEIEHDRLQRNILNEFVWFLFYKLDYV